MTKQIVVGYDASQPSSDALLWAAGEADARGAQLRLVSCYELPFAGEAFGGWVATEAYAALLEDCQDNLAEIKAIVARTHPDLKVVTEASAGPATAALVDNVGPDDLIAIGARGHFSAASLLLGSTARYLVRHSPCPVAVVRGNATVGRPDRVVVGVDGSSASDRAVQWAGNEAELHGVELVIIHGWEYPYVPGEATQPARDLTNVDAACLVDRVVESAREQFGVTVTGQLAEGTPATAILASVLDGDLLVLGSRGRGAIAANLFGSTVNTVLDRSAVPVVVVRGAEE